MIDCQRVSRRSNNGRSSVFFNGEVLPSGTLIKEGVRSLNVVEYANAGLLGKTVRDSMRCVRSQNVFEPFGRKINWDDAADYIVALFSIEKNRELVFTSADPKKGAKAAFWDIPFSRGKDAGSNLKFFIETLVNNDRAMYELVLKGMIEHYNGDFINSCGSLNI